MSSGSVAPSGVILAPRYREGILFAYISPPALEHDIRAMEPLRQYGIEVPTPVWGDDVRALEPALSSSVSGGFLYAGERHVRPESLTAGLVTWLRGRTVTILTDAAVTGFDRMDNRIDAVQTTQGRIAADAVLLCTGAWTRRVAKLAGVTLPFQGGKGYSLDYAPAPVAVRRPLYLHEARVAVTPMNGMVRLAGTMEFSGFNEMIREKRVKAIARAATRVLDEWPADHRVAAVSSGLRPMTPDGLPTIGWLPGFRNAAVAAGHGMLGLTLAPATAVAVADLLTTGTTPDVLRPFDPARFDSDVPIRRRETEIKSLRFL
jgi:D-amino-acid dehydrogenase